MGAWPLTHLPTMLETSNVLHWAGSLAPIETWLEAVAASKSPPCDAHPVPPVVSYQVAPSPVQVGTLSRPVPSFQLAVSG